MVSTREVDAYHGSAEVVAGYVGLPGIARKLQVGDTIIFDTPEEGAFEVRLLAIRKSYADPSADLLVTQVAEARALAVGWALSDLTNSQFSEQELLRISEGLGRVREAVSQRSDVSSGQFDYISRKLDEMSEAAQRMGRRDWINLAVGTIVNAVVTAGLSKDAAATFVQLVGAALKWLLGGPLSLSP